MIYVVDSSDRDRMGISKSELVAMLEVDNDNNNCLYNWIALPHLDVLSLMLCLPAGRRAEESHSSCLCQ